MIRKEIKIDTLNSAEDVSKLLRLLLQEEQNTLFEVVVEEVNALYIPTINNYITAFSLKVDFRQIYGLEETRQILNQLNYNNSFGIDAKESINKLIFSYGREITINDFSLFIKFQQLCQDSLIQTLNN